MTTPWREILIDVEPRGKEFRLGVDGEATPADILSLIEERCKEEGIDMVEWAKKQVGGDYQLVFLRKAEANAILSPGVPLKDVSPPIENNERFKIAAQPVVGVLPVAIVNRRVDSLIEEFYNSVLGELYRKENWELPSVKREGHTWHHSQFEVSITNFHKDGAYQTLIFTIHGIPGITAVEKGEIKLSYSHKFKFNLSREYPQNLSHIRISNLTPLYHPRINGIGGNACYTVNGEVDRILLDIMYNVLLRPETVRPPSQFKDSDWGMDRGKMEWYIHYGPQKIYTYLKEKWGERQKKIDDPIRSKKSKVKVMVLEDE